MSCHVFVSHVTGFATHFGLELAHHTALSAFSILSVPAYYLLGGMISAYLTDRKSLHRAIPRPDYVFALMLILISIVLIAGVKGWLGPFGMPLRVTDYYLLLALLSMTCGLQNSLFSPSTGAVIRTTHLTGTTTDLAIGLVRLFTVKKAPDFNPANEIKMNWLRFGSIIAFVFGSAIQSYLCLHHEYRGLWLPFATTAHFLFLAHFFYRRERLHHIPNIKRI